MTLYEKFNKTMTAGFLLLAAGGLAFTMGCGSESPPPEKEGEPSAKVTAGPEKGTPDKAGPGARNKAGGAGGPGARNKAGGAGDRKKAGPRKTAKIPPPKVRYCEEVKFLEINHPLGRGAPAKSRFGATTAVLDFNQDGIMDIAVGSPGEGAVYLFRGPAFKNFLLLKPATDQPEAGFGYALVGADLDGKPGQELVVGSPEAEVKGVPGAGKVYVFVRTQIEPLVITAPAPWKNAILGSSLAAGELDGKPGVELAAGAPGDSVEGTACGKVYLFDPFTGQAKAVIENPQKKSQGNFGHKLAAADGTGDGKADLFVSAVGNDSTNGIEKAGQILVYKGPVPDGGALIVENHTMKKGEEMTRFGMDIFVRDQDGDCVADLALGAPRSDVMSVKDAGLGFLFYGPWFKSGRAVVRARLGPDPGEDDTLGFRALMANCLGDGKPELIFSSLPLPSSGRPRALVIWDGSNLKEDPFILRAMEGASDHYVQGLSAGQLFEGGYEELILGDPNFDHDKAEDVGRVMLALFD